MMDLRALAEEDLLDTLEGDFATPVILVTPEGEYVAETAEGTTLKGRVLWSRKETNLETGEPVTVPSPLVTLRESSLTRIPKTGEKWLVQIPSGPRPGSPLTEYLLDMASVVEDGRNHGVIHLPLLMVEQDESI